MMHVYEFLQRNGPSIFVLLFVPLLMISLIIWWTWRVSPRIGKLLMTVIVFAIAAFVAAKSVSPAGKYFYPYCRITAEGEHLPDDWIELSGGVYYDVVAGNRHRAGSYYKKDGHWILQKGKRPDGGVCEQQIRFSVLGLVVNPPTVGAVEREEPMFTRRRIIPFARPHWIPECLE